MCPLGDDAAAAIATGLRTNRSLQVLDLYKTKLADQGAVALASALASAWQTSKLCELSLESCLVCEKPAIDALADCLRVNNALGELRLAG